MNANFESRLATLYLNLEGLAAPIQNLKEWRYFLSFLDSYFMRHGIEHPVIVELGTRGNRQKPYYETLFGATHIGIDGCMTFEPDIFGNTHEPGTLAALKERLAGKSINLLFIDADHAFRAVKQDYETYGPLTENIIALHDIFNKAEQVNQFWREIQEQDPEWMKLAIYNWLPEPHVFAFMQFGIGLILKKW